MYEHHWKEISRNHGNVQDLRPYESAETAVDRVTEIYQQSCARIRTAFDQFATTGLKDLPELNAFYPYIGMTIAPSTFQQDARYAYGVVDEPGAYGSTVTRPELFREYYLQQIRYLMENYRQPILVGVSDWPIPMPFVIDHSTSELTPHQLEEIKLGFVLPQLTRVDDSVVNHTHRPKEGTPNPLTLFSGERVDYSLNRLYHYTGTQPEHFQNFILLTNYQRYMSSFKAYAQEKLRVEGPYQDFIEPAISPSGNLPQMPAYHLKRAGKNGITFINIGVGPTNAKNITDHLAVLRPHCWLMLGHCAGLRSTQILGDYVLAHGYVREDYVLDQDLPTWVPIPPIAEIQIALEEAVAEVTGLRDRELKKRMRTGTIFTTSNRNWELRSEDIYERFNQSRAIALDMESATISANGLRFRVPYGTLLCVSDKPIHGEIKLRGTTNKFFNNSVEQHLAIGLKTIEIIQRRGVVSLHSRKLRAFNEPPFR